MKILVLDSPVENGYIESLMKGYQSLDHEVFCDTNNFFYTNLAPDLLHIHWPESIYKWYKYQSVKNENIYEIIKKRITWFKENNTIIAHTIHNLKPHDDHDELDSDIFELILFKSDILVHHCEKSKRLLSDAYPELNLENKINVISPLGDYLIHFKKVDKSDARKKYGIPKDKIVVLNFGIQRPYKNESFISKVFSNVPSKNKYLLIAGSFRSETNNILSQLYFRARNKIRKHLSFRNKKYMYKHFELDELPYLLSCADIALLGQKSALNSGFISLAATYSIPLVIPDTGCFRESAKNWIYESFMPGNIDDASEKMKKLIKLVENNEELSNAKWLAERDWKGHVKTILEEVRKINQV